MDDTDKMMLLDMNDAEPAPDYLFYLSYLANIVKINMEVINKPSKTKSFIYVHFDFLSLEYSWRIHASMVPSNYLVDKSKCLSCCNVNIGHDVLLELYSI